MPCYSPLDGWYAQKRGPSGKKRIVFSGSERDVRRPITVPCGQCIGCRLEYARQWAVRCTHEASLYSDNAFVTLTYDNEFLPPMGSLVKSDLQKFIKRLREKESRSDDGRAIRYFACGEYGDKSNRPHYHCLLFNYWPVDAEKRVASGYPAWTSRELTKLWPHGHHLVNAVNWNTVGYVTQYSVKKVRGKNAENDASYLVVDTGSGEIVGEKEKEFALMSRRPGIGAPWLEKFGAETYRDDSVVMNGVEMLPPKFYDCKYEVVDGERVRKLKRDRVGKVCYEDQRSLRLASREKVAKARNSTYRKREKN